VGPLVHGHKKRGVGEGLSTLRLCCTVGSLPSGWSSGFGSLQQLLVESNGLDGELPSEWSSGFGSLQRLDVSGNDLTGSIPSSWGDGGAFPNVATLGL